MNGFYPPMYKSWLIERLTRGRDEEFWALKDINPRY